MKQIVLGCGLAAALLWAWALAGVAPAQARQDAAEPRMHDRIELTRAAVELNRKEAVANALELSESEAQAFWPLYRKYHAERPDGGR